MSCKDTTKKNTNNRITCKCGEKKLANMVKKCKSLCNYSLCSFDNNAQTHS